MSTEADLRRQIRLQQEELAGLISSLQIEQVVNGLLREDVRKLQDSARAQMEALDGMAKQD